MPDGVGSPQAVTAPAAPAASHSCCSSHDAPEQGSAPEFLGMPALPVAAPVAAQAPASCCSTEPEPVAAQPATPAASCCSTEPAAARKAPEFLGLPTLPTLPAASASRGTDAATDVEHLEAIAATVNDPEIPVLSIKDLGILRGVRLEGGEVVVTITPTYSGCPAMDTIADDLRIAFQDAGYTGTRIELTLSPAWTTDWMSQEGKAKLAEYGIAPPSPRREGDRLRLAMAVKCPRCHSLDTRELSRFGSTSCKALYQCNACQEPFDFFKAL